MPLNPPYLVSAVFCDKVLLEQDGVPSAIRIVDRIFVQKLSKEGVVPGGLYALTLLLMFKSGGYKGAAKIQIILRPPSGAGRPIIEQEIVIPEQVNAGANIVATVPLAPNEEGVYWFDVLLNGELVTRTPLEVQVLPLQVPSSPSAKTESDTNSDGKK